MAYPDTLNSIGVVQVATTAPPAGVKGDLWYNPSSGVLSVVSGGAWVATGGGGGGPAALPEVSVGATKPTGSEVIWIDTHDPSYTYVHYKTGVSWITGNDGGRF